MLWQCDEHIHYMSISLLKQKGIWRWSCRTRGDFAPKKGKSAISDCSETAPLSTLHGAGEGN